MSNRDKIRGASRLRKVQKVERNLTSEEVSYIGRGDCCGKQANGSGADSNETLLLVLCACATIPLLRNFGLVVPRPRLAGM